jgi:thiamine phosphate synthase YjbQ (UPF0047 family)
MASCIGSCGFRVEVGCEDGNGGIEIITRQIEEELRVNKKLWTGQQEDKKNDGVLQFGVHITIAQPEGTQVALTLNENCDDLVQSDMLRALAEVQHGCSNAHQRRIAREALAEGSSLTLQCDARNFKLQLGTWQGVYALCWPNPDYQHKQVCEYVHV